MFSHTGKGLVAASSSSIVPSSNRIMSQKLGGFVPRTYFIASFKSSSGALTYWMTVQIVDESHLSHTSLWTVLTERNTVIIIHAISQKHKGCRRHP